MNPSLTRYYLTRALMAIALAALLALTGLSWWLAGLAGAVTLAWFLWAPRSGRYLVSEEGGAAPCAAMSAARPSLTGRHATPSW